MWPSHARIIIPPVSEPAGNPLEAITKDGIVFDYKPCDGRATSRNAIKLMQLMGYSPEIVEEAEKRADIFVKQGIRQEISSQSGVKE